MGVCAAIIAAGGQMTGTLALVFVAVLAAAAGANGLTNYLDRNVDARMERTRGRALPSRRIHPPWKVLPFLAVLIVTGLVLAWHLHPYVFGADLLGTIMAATWRKKVTCVYPQGVVSSCAPVLMGWFAVKPALDWEVLLLCILIAAWLPLHVWSVIIANRDDYLNAGLTFFPISYDVSWSVKILLVFALVLYASSIALYAIGGFTWVYLALANAMGIFMIYATVRLVRSRAAADAWRLYKLSSFPYLGAIFVVMCLDIWLLG